MTFNGKQNDIRIDLLDILYVELPDCNLGFEIPKKQVVKWVMP